MASNSHAVKEAEGATTPSQLVRQGTKGGDHGNEDLDTWMKSRQMVKPEDQLELTEAELGEEVTRILTFTNTNIIPNLVVYSFKDGAFVPVPKPPNTVCLLQYEGTALHFDSEEAKEQIEEGDMGYPLPMPRFSVVEEEKDEGDSDNDGEERGGKAGGGKAGKKKKASQADLEGEEGEEEEMGEEEERGSDEKTEEAVEEGDVQDGEAEGEGEGEGEAEMETVTQAKAPPPGKKRKLVNQFNFCERGALTYNFPTRSVDTQTAPAARSQYGGTVLQWVIYDNYIEDDELQHADKKAEDPKKILGTRSNDEAKRHMKAMEAENMNKKFLRAWQILERMINQNIYDDVANDYRYWEDPADEFREDDGTLLPLWKFQYDRVKRLSVTDLCFNPLYYDLFAVCYGSHDFMKQPSEGALCLFTIKNPSYPDYIVLTECGVMCVDIHPKYPFLVVIGLYDGNVLVYNLRESITEPLYASKGSCGKHDECIWEIKWGPDMPDGEINFYSASSDGRIFNWILMQNKLAITSIMTLFLYGYTQCDGPDGTTIKLRSNACCLKFHPTDPEIYLVGTEEGFLYKCSIAFSSTYIMTYHAHSLSIYRIDYNRFNSNIFISCSGDWRVKIWEDMREDPLFIFDLGSAVGDVKWAPYSSTVFAAVTREGKVVVYDLNVSKYKPICTQNVVPKRKNKLTRICFDEKLPFIIVGDDKGTVTSLKLSPNLRVMVKPPKKQLYLDQSTLQIQKLDRLLSLVRELPEGAVIQDTGTTVAS